VVATVVAASDTSIVARSLPFPSVTENTLDGSHLSIDLPTRRDDHSLKRASRRGAMPPSQTTEAGLSSAAEPRLAMNPAPQAAFVLAQGGLRGLRHAAILRVLGCKQALGERHKKARAGFSRRQTMPSLFGPALGTVGYCSATSAQPASTTVL